LSKHFVLGQHLLSRERKVNTLIGAVTVYFLLHLLQVPRLRLLVHHLDILLTLPYFVTTLC
jgi:hypothetical protein